MTCSPSIPGAMRHLALCCLACATVLAACGEASPVIRPMDRALAALDRGDGFGAELALRELLDSGTRPEELAAYLGQAELQQGQPVEARRWLGEGRFSRATAGHGFHMLGRLEMREGNLPEAGQAFDRSIEFSPDSPRLWADIGRLRYRGGEQTLALEAGIKAVKLGPDDPEALLFRGQMVRDAEGMRAALPWLERAAKAGPDQLDLLAEYAATLGEAGEPRRMLEVVRRVTAREPGFLRSYFLQAVLAARAGKYGLARKLLLRSGEEASASPAGLLLAGVIDLETGNYASAAQGLDRLYQMQPENRRVRDLLARALAMGGSHRELVHRFDSAALMTSASPYLQTLVARAHETLGDRNKAAVLLDLAAASRTGNLVALRPAANFADSGSLEARSGDDVLGLVRSRIIAGKAGEAIRLANGFLARFPGSADALALAGDAQLSAGNSAQAMALYRKSALVRQSWPLARRRIAAYRGAGRAGDADRLLESYIDGHSAAVEPAVLLARIRLDRGFLAPAAALLDHALKAGGDRDPETLALRAIVAWRMQQPTLARAMAERAFEVQPMNGASVRALAMVSKGELSRVLMARLDRMAQIGRGSSP